MTRREEFDALMKRYYEEYYDLETDQYITVDESAIEEIENAIYDKRQNYDFDLLAFDGDDTAYYIRAHCYEDEESPDGQAHDLQLFTARKDGTTDHFDAGMLWGYPDAYAAVDSELFDLDDESVTYYELDRYEDGDIVDSFECFNAVDWDLLEAFASTHSEFDFTQYKEG